MSLKERHIKGSKGYISGRIFLAIPLEEIQQIINEKAGFMGLLTNA